jgi:hypothetical protein
MGIYYQSRAIGEVRAIRLGAAPAAGAALMRFTLEWSVHPKRDQDYSIFGTYIRVSVSPEGTSDWLHLGHGIPDVAWTEQARVGIPYRFPLYYNLTLTASQLLALETIRQQRGLVFKIEVRGNASGKDGICSIDDTLTLSVSLGEWLRVLDEAGNSDALLVALPLPLAVDAASTDAPTEIVRKAHQFLLHGQSDSCIAQCRRAIESLRNLHGFGTEARAAREALASRGERVAMTKRARTLAVAEAIVNFTQPAHHVGEDGRAEDFSRLDAVLTLSATAALIGIVSAPTTSKSEIGD